MSLTLKLMIPLISDNITVDDLSEECGFVNAFTNDINKPYLDNHVFLMYEWDTNSHKKFKRYMKLKKDKNIHSCMKYIINGKKYLIYVYCLKGKEITELKSNYITFTGQKKLKIIDFWRTKDKDINEYALSPFINYTEYKASYVPEIDYTENKKTRWPYI